MTNNNSDSQNQYVNKISLLLLMIFQIFKTVLQIVVIVLIIIFNLTSLNSSNGNRLNACSIYINNKYNFYYDKIFIMVFALNAISTFLCILSLVLIIKQFYTQRKNSENIDNSPLQLNRFNKILQIYYILIAAQGLVVSIGFGQYFNIFFQNKNCNNDAINNQYLTICAIQGAILLIIFVLWVLILRCFNYFNQFKDTLVSDQKDQLNNYLTNNQNRQTRKNNSNIGYQLSNSKQANSKGQKNMMQESLLDNQNKNFSIFQQNQNYYNQKGNNQYITMNPIMQNQQQDQDYSQRQFNQNHQYLVYENQDAKNRTKQLEKAKYGQNYQDAQNQMKQIKKNEQMKNKNIKEGQGQKNIKYMINQKGELIIPKKDKRNQLKRISLNSNVISYNSNNLDELEDINIFTPILTNLNVPLKLKEMSGFKLEKQKQSGINFSKQEKKQKKEGKDINSNISYQQEANGNKKGSNNLKHKYANLMKKQQNKIFEECPINKFINEDQKYQNQQEKIYKFMKINKKKKKNLLFTQDDNEGAKLYFHKRKNDEQRVNTSTSYNLFIDQYELDQIKLMSQSLYQMKQRQGISNQKSQIKAKLKQFQMNSNNVNDNDQNASVDSKGGLINKKGIKKESQLLDFIRSKFID